MNDSLKKNWGWGLGILLATSGFNTAFAASDSLFTRVDSASVCPPEYIPAIYVAPLSKNATDEEKAEQASAAESIAIEADQIESTKSGQMSFKGNAVTVYNGRRISGDILGFDQETSVLTGSGNVKLLNSYGDALNTSELRLNTETSIGETGPATYLLGDRTIPTGQDKKAVMQARGSADVLEFQGQDLLSLQNARYTTCKTGNDDVVVTAKKVDLDMSTGIGVARNATVRFLGLPIMYTPYLSFPLGNQRKSGFLFPTVGSEGDSGTVVMLPYYWNIAPNMDATITPKYMSERGLQALTEFRYLTETSAGLFRGEYLPDDKLFEDDRWGVLYQHDQVIGENWSGQILYQDVSDNDYLDDLQNDLATAATQFLPQQASLGYASDTVNFSVLARKLKTIDANIKPEDEPHRELPRAALSAFNAYEPNTLKYGFDSEFVSFDHDANITGQRIHVEPSVSLPMEAVYGFLTPKVAVDYTSYSVDDIPVVSDNPADDAVDFGDTADNADATTTAAGGTSDSTTTADNSGASSNNATQGKAVAAKATQISSNPSRTVPIFSLDSGLYFERDAVFGGRSYTQTLEPRVFYLYVPEENQDDFPVFDTSDLNQNTVTNLFQPNRFTSYDRLGDANQVTLALTTSLIDFDDGTEVLRGSIGQIYYLEDRLVTLSGEPETNSTSGIVTELTARLGKRALSPREQRLKQVKLERSRLVGNDWYRASEIGSERVNINTTLVWDTDEATVSEGRLDVAYTPNSYSLLDFEYTYRENNGKTITDQYNLQAVVPVTRQFFLYGGYRYDANNSKTLEGKGGIEYRNCCWAFRVYGTRRINNDTKEDEYRDSIMAELELTGLATIRSRAGLR